MRIFIGLLFLLVTSSTSAQDKDVQLHFDKESITQGDSLRFSVWANSNEIVEIYVLSGEFLGFQQKVQLAYSEFPIALSTLTFPAGKYFILITGEGIHIEREFLVRELKK